MEPLRRFLSNLHNINAGTFMVDGIINSDSPVINELNRIDPFYSLKFSLQPNNTNDVIRLIEDWAPRARAEIKHIYWKDRESIVTIHYGLEYVEVESRSIRFADMCGDYANQMGYRLRRGPR